MAPRNTAARRDRRPKPPGVDAPQRYVIALGSNQPRSRTLTPEKLVERAMAALSAPPFRAIRRSPILPTPPLGPSRRRYANAAILVETGAAMTPDALLRHLKAMERAAGRRPSRRWGSRPLDLDIILWSGGRWTSPGLIVPHKAYRERRFVLAPLAAIAPHWPDPTTRRHPRQLLARLKKPQAARNRLTRAR